MKKSRPLDQPDADAEMSFLEHLEVLRWHLIRTVLVLIVFTILAFILKSFVFDTVFLGPYNLNFWTYKKLCVLSNLLGFGDALCINDLGFEFANMAMAGQFMLHIRVSLIAGLILTVPYALWEFWRFFKPALSIKERRGTQGIVLSGTFLFMIGLLFGYYLIAPITIHFLGTYRVSNQVQNLISIKDYISTIAMTCFSMALVFELPIVVYFLSVPGILTPTIMRKYRKHAVLVIVVIAAIITPSTDVLSQLLVSLPFMFLYELSIFVSKFVSNKNKKQLT